MKEHPIIFNSEMVQAILEGRKTQTRRVCTHLYDGSWCLDPEDSDEDRSKLIEACPYGKTGDFLWVRESFAVDACGLYHFGRATWKGLKPELRWRPAIHLPRTMSRITLEIVSVRVERIEDIMDDDIEAEGTPYNPMQQMSYRNDSFQRRRDFVWLWNSINAKRGYGYDADPWVWVISFKRIKEAYNG